MKHFSALLIIVAILSTKSPAQITAALSHDLPVDCCLGSSPVDSNVPVSNKVDVPSIETATITVQNFSSTLSAKKVILNWSVTENKGGNYFEVQRSKDGKNYTACGLVFCSEKSGAEDYMFYEAKQNAGTYYRLKIVNQDLQIAFSTPVTVLSKKEVAESRISIVQSDATNDLTLTYHSLFDGAQKVFVYDWNGTVVYANTLNFSKGTNMIHLSLEKALKTGTYVAEVVTTGERITAKFITK